MKKSQFKGVDFFVVEKYKAPIEKFNKMNDFQKWCNECIQKIKTIDFSGRQDGTKISRENLLEEWFDFVTNETYYKSSTALMILKAITKELKPNDDTLPLQLNKDVLKQTVINAEEKLDKDKKALFDFNMLYRKNLQNDIFKDNKRSESVTCGWIVIPSKIQDEKNFAQNVCKLKAFSHSNWCTKTFNAEYLLSNGEFHIYLKNNKPKIAVRFAGDSIEEIQEDKHNGLLSLDNYDTILNYIRNFKMNERTCSQLRNLELAKREVQEILAKKFPKGVENYETKETLEKFDIICKENPDGTLTISEYHQPDWNITYRDLGINEKKFFEIIKKIEGKVNFSGSDITNTGILEEMCDDVFFMGSKIISLPNVRKIGGNVLFCSSIVSDIPMLKEIGHDALIMNSKINNLRGVSVGGNIFN